jgi:hypothetical protein
MRIINSRRREAKNLEIIWETRRGLFNGLRYKKCKTIANFLFKNIAPNGQHNITSYSKVMTTGLSQIDK